MKGFMKSRRGEKGFTLVELLVVFTLLAVLAAIMIPSVSSLLGYGHDQAAATELSVVQTAMDTMMAVGSLDAVTPETAPGTSDFIALPAEGALYPDYLRSENTTGTYSWDGTGKVTLEDSGY
jgi:type IV pilus assembly protein PilA